jgi:hypothetical protein
MTPALLALTLVAAAGGSPVPQHLTSIPDLTQLHLRSHPKAPPKHLEEKPPKHAPLTKPAPFSAHGAPAHWSSAAGHAALTKHSAVGHLDGKLAAAMSHHRKPKHKTGPGAGACEAVTITENPDCGCASYGIPDQTAGKTPVYLQPLHAFGSEQSARNFAITVAPKLPMTYPFHDPSVHPVQGWFYSSGDFHGAVDYMKDGDQYGGGKDPSFPVHAIADGRVVTVVWDSWSGNIVVIEHVAHDGSKYRTAYFHLRNGFKHDLAQALKTDPGKDPSGSPAKYLKFAKLPNPSHQYWGTEAQKILVKPGQTVHRGQQIAWSGDTGPGGAGKGLNDDGTPSDSNTANNHLHLMTAVPHPTQAGNWVQVDPYGVYGQIGDDCYDLDAGPAYARLFAPFPPSFNNLPADAFLKYWSYYLQMGMVLQTLSVHRHGGDVLTSGSFQTGIENDWWVYFYLPRAEAQAKFDAFFKKGYRPRELSVTPDDSGQPRFNMIWKKMKGESFYAFFDLTDADWQKKWDDLVKKQHYRVEDQFEYGGAGGSRHHAAIFVKDGPADFYELHDTSFAQFQKSFDDYYKKGYQLQDFNAALLASTTYGGIWRKKPGYWITHFDVSPADYQNIFWDLQNKGYRLWKIQGYADSQKFGAIWTK